MKATITFIPDERVVYIFKKVTGLFSNKFASQLLDLVLISLQSKYVEKYLQATSLSDVEKVDELLSNEINTLLKTKEQFTSREPIRMPGIQPYTYPYTQPFVSPVERRPFDITCLQSTQS